MIDATRLGFEPLIAWPAVYALGALALLLWAVYAVRRGRAWLTRAGALSVLALALANPALVREEREPLSSVAAIVVDRSESMAFGDRQAVADAALDALSAELDADESLDVRLVETDPDADGTELFAAAEGALADVPRDRVAGAVLITDGQVHDQPRGGVAPVHALIVGDPDRGDRRIEIVNGPSFGIVGERARFTLRVDDPDGGVVPVQVSLNGDRLRTLSLQAGVPSEVEIEIERRQDNILVVEAPPGREELTLANNSAAAVVAGVRDRLRVLLITGRPNAAGRVWRDLLKSDPQVDLVHFTILRPPETITFENIEELALIPFPREELFEEKLWEFDLIIFDQYERRGTVLTSTYFNNIARYVDDGGALMVIAGEPFAQSTSLARTALTSVLPASPTGDIAENPYDPALTEAGRRHSVTAPLDGREWGGWLRRIGATARTGDVLMSAPGGTDPLLIVDRVGDGRVGLLLSDQIWLWARGYDGGGPFAELIRRLVHWLMKEPELEERRLDLAAAGGRATARLRTLSDTPPPLELETPEGEVRIFDWIEAGPGEFSAEADVDQLGLWRARAGDLETVALNGPANAREYADLRATTEVLAPLLEPTGGRAFQRPDGDVPDVRRVGPRGEAAGGDWLGLRERGAYAVRDSRSEPLLPGWLGVLLALGLAMLAWRREGR